MQRRLSNKNGGSECCTLERTGRGTDSQNNAVERRNYSIISNNSHKVFTSL